MADPGDRKKYGNDSRIACKYGATCYQKNSAHLQKYKHPPPKPKRQNATTTQPNKRFKVNVDIKDDPRDDPKTTTDVKSETDESDEETVKNCPQKDREDDKADKTDKAPVQESTDIDNESDVTDLRRTPNVSPKGSIKDKKDDKTDKGLKTAQGSIELDNESDVADLQRTLKNLSPKKAIKDKEDDKTDKQLKPEQESMSIDNEPDVSNLGRTPKNFNPKGFIKEKFLVQMPEDFYNFWEFCKNLKGQSPQEAFKDVGLTLVGPFDVLAGKFYDIPEQPAHNYLVHWRYYYDSPECQTVLKGDDRTGYHICYFRDCPKELPVFLVSNCVKTDGVFKVMGDNIFAAVYLYLEDLKKHGDPFKRMHVGRLQNAIKKKAEELKLSLAERTDKINDRDKKIVTRSFNKIGVVVPYNRRTQLGYRNLGVTNKAFRKQLDDIQKALPDQRQKYLSVLQDILTNVSIATDEGDFGNGIELGLNILAHGVNSLNQTISRFLATSYRLMNREEFAKIAEAHMKNRKRGTNLSIV